MAYKKIPSEVIAEIIDKCDIYSIINSFVVLSKKGNDYVGLCPFHSDNTPSMSVSPQKNIFKCFSCGVGGDAVSFVKRFKNCTYIEAVEYIANQTGFNFNFDEYKTVEKSFYSDEQIDNIEVLKLANVQYKLEILENKEALEYLESRGLNSNIREKFDIGYVSKKGIFTELNKNLGFDFKSLINSGIINTDFHEIIIDRVTFAIKNNNGDIVGFSGRSIGEKTPKYINTPSTELFNKSKILYNYSNAKETIEIKKEVIITEGFMDTIALYKVGLYNVVSIMGTAFTKNHVNYLKNLTVILFLDNDNAGINASKKTIKFLLENNLKVRVIKNDFNKDPDEVFNNYGPETLLNMVKNNQQLAIDYIYETLVKTYKLSSNSSSEAVNKFQDEFNNFLQHYSENYKTIFKDKLQKLFNITLKTPTKKIDDSTYESVSYEKIDYLPTDIFIPEKNRTKTVLVNPVYKKNYPTREGYFSYTNNLLNTMLKYVLESEVFLNVFSSKKDFFTKEIAEKHYQVYFLTQIKNISKDKDINHDLFSKMINYYKQIFILSLSQKFEDKNDFINYLKNLKKDGIITQYNLDNNDKDISLLKKVINENKNSIKKYDDIQISKESLSHEKSCKEKLQNFESRLIRMKSDMIINNFTKYGTSELNKRAILKTYERQRKENEEKLIPSKKLEK